MAHIQITMTGDTALKSEKTISSEKAIARKSPEEIQLLLLHKIEELEGRLKVIEHQTKTHWVS